MWRGGSVEEWECGVPRRGVEELHAYLPSWWRSVDVESLVDGLFRFVDEGGAKRRRSGTNQIRGEEGV